MADSLDVVQTRAERLARGWLVGAFATGVAAVSHTLAGGYRPDPLGLGAALVFAGMLGTLAIGRRPSLPRLVIAVTGAQLGFHVLFSFLGVAPGTSTAGSMPGMRMDTVATTPPAMHDHLGHLVDPGMWAAHAIAAVLTVLFLRRVELAVWTMLRRLVIRMLRMPTPATIAPPVEPPVARVRVLRSRQLVAALPLRGPPLLPSH